MPGRPILVDVTRLLTRRLHRTPTGIDRVEFAYAAHFLARPDSRAIAITRWGTRIVPAAKATGLLRSLSHRWMGGDGARESKAAALRLRRWLSGRPEGRDRDRPGSGPIAITLDQSAVSMESIGWRVAEDAPADAIYLHASHLRLDKPRHFTWLDRRPDISSVFFVHDLIPIEYPEYVVRGEDDRHRARMETVARRGAAVVTNSQDVADRFTALLAREGWPAVPTVAVPLGVEDAFLEGATPFPASKPYFVICSTLEPRKNHLLLLQIWRDVAEQLGDATPALVIVGRRGWENASTLDLLDRCPSLKRYVTEVNGLQTKDLVRLVAGARALLSPSFAEGYGIPIAEALSVGTPVVVSDIPAHREVTEGGRATLLHPLDGVGWRRAVMEAATGPNSDGGGSAYRPPTWSAHFAAVDQMLERLVAGRNG